MQYTTYEVEEAKQAFKKIKLKTQIMTIPLKLCIIIFFVVRILIKEEFTNFIETTRFYGIRLDVVFFTFSILMLIIALISTFVWKCPHCGKRFGKERRFKHCMHCGIELQD
ncbi:hypothetical protein [Oceanirhabdus sp. W0125-5]|uniref:hypothetical protein n=1 Tax=Oceanirhabdus sp. W0125-5 TaxID=2999116 RepID=UPI0022F317A7|nr:hypothetical protein [Oceanirhabdus sp. W0125-5]WBW96723.1 hypothetical protein OW730_23970 [Oceanirhabdus sp. W0125-5]